MMLLVEKEAPEIFHFPASLLDKSVSKRLLLDFDDVVNYAASKNPNLPLHGLNSIDSGFVRTKPQGPENHKDP